MALQLGPILLFIYIAIPWWKIICKIKWESPLRRSSPGPTDKTPFPAGRSSRELRIESIEHPGKCEVQRQLVRAVLRLGRQFISANGTNLPYLLLPGLLWVMMYVCTCELCRGKVFRGISWEGIGDYMFIAVGTLWLCRLSTAVFGSAVFTMLYLRFPTRPD